MSVLTDMANCRVKDIDERIARQVEYIKTTQEELAAARSDLDLWRIDRAELVEFLSKQGITVEPEKPIKTSA